jgi:hypothetical protein
MGLQRLVDARQNDPDCVILTIDMTNAFNALSRGAVLEQAQTRCPSLFNFLRFSYQLHAPLFTGGQVIQSQTGVHQGCPLGPIGFAMGIHPVIEAVQKTAGLLWQTWYLDDGLLIGDPAAISAAFQQARAELCRRGLHINAKKCELWGLGAGYCTNMGEVRTVPWDSKTGITVLGVPINYPGSMAQSNSAWDQATSKLKITLENVTSVTDAQTAHHLLRKCLDACRVNHLMRASDTYQCAPLLQACDTAIMGAFEDIVSHGLSNTQKVQASLPLSTGGCGIRNPSSIRPAARISALAAFYTRGRSAVGTPDQDMGVNSTWVGPVLSELTTALGPSFDPLPGWSGLHARLLSAEPEHLQQKWWSANLGKRAMHQLLDHS